MNLHRWYLLYFCVLFVTAVLLYRRGGCTAVSPRVLAAGALAVVILALIQAAHAGGMLLQDCREYEFICRVRLYVIYIASQILILKGIVHGIRQIYRG